MPSPVPRVELPLLYWNGFRILADHTLITIVDLSNDPEIEKATIKANTIIFEFCEIVKQLAKQGE